MIKKISFVYDLTDEYRTVGICSHLKDYKLCWNLNKVLNYNLIRFDDFVPEGKKTTDERYTFFYFYDQNHRNGVYLLSNKKNNIPLLEKIPEADYLLMIKGVCTEKKTKELISGIKKISNVLTVFQVEMDKIKTINSFLTELELHQLYQEKKK